VARTAEIRVRFADALQDAGYSVAPSHTNFVLVRFDDAVEAEAGSLPLSGIQGRIVVRWDE